MGEKNIKQWIFAPPSPYLSAAIGISNERKAFHCQFTRKTSLSMKLPNFPQIYLCHHSNTVLSPLLHFQSLWHTPMKLSHVDSAFKRGIRTQLNWITSPLPTLMTAINFANSADGKPVIWWLLCNWIAGLWCYRVQKVAWSGGPPTAADAVREAVIWESALSTWRNYKF